MFKILNIFCIGDWELILHLELGFGICLGFSVTPKDGSAYRLASDLGFAFPPKSKEVKKDGLKIIC
jgi:hypothetical protein